MYTVTVVDDFVAQHVLTVPDPPAGEGDVHSHHFEVELTFRGPELNEYDYLVDIDDVNATLSRLHERYADTLLNDLPEFEGYNPSVERFTRVVWDRVTDRVTDSTIERVRVTIWEDDEAHAAYEAAV